MKFVNKLKRAMKTNQSLLCVGLDSDVTRLGKKSQLEFNKNIIEMTHDLVCAYKPNVAFYEAEGARGIEALKLTREYLSDKYPNIPVILDAKRGDIGNTNEGYAKFAFEYLGMDAVTVHPYMGLGSLTPFEKYENKGIIVLVKTSNPESGEFEDQVLLETGEALWKKVAREASQKWQKNQQWMVVVGATYPRQLEEAREIVGEMPILVPGVGAQGGKMEDVLNERTSRGRDIIINVSRGVLFAENPRAEAEKLRKLSVNFVEE